MEKNGNVSNHLSRKKLKSYTTDRVGARNLLKQIGFSYQSAGGFYPEPDKQKQDEFKEEVKKDVRKT